MVLMTKKTTQSAEEDPVAVDKLLQERLENSQLLPRDERRKLTAELLARKPGFLKPYTPIWWWRRCEVNVLIVADGSLNFSPVNAFGLSEFLTTFPQLEAESNVHISYNPTLAVRGTGLGLPLGSNTNPRTVARLENFDFSKGNLGNYDQIWLFGILSGSGLTGAEKTALEGFMNGGGGLFATGDHGSLGSAMGANLLRVGDMRHWADFPTSGTSDPLNEVSMQGVRRNDTNRPLPGDPFATQFNRQSDDIPQVIMPRVFAGGLPHPLLSIPASKRPSQIIDIMPDHPHEGQCKPEASFTTPNGTVLSSQPFFPCAGTHAL
jgi:hypothetical protein